MKAFLFALLAATLCMERAGALRCFTCNDEPSHWNCIEITDCAENEKYCLTSYTRTGFGEKAEYRITKRCSDVCPRTNLNFGIAATAISCCQRSLCNVSGAGSVRASATAMATGILVGLLYVLRTGL
ncbi:lymphocyte antigen 6E-like [Pelodiscus sinensis]|uniref:lymphocyte antigen 6E-like n=1 Tax=Pelodiscus sinensis TaxID=13735 RepID=UPI0003C44B91|nr:lymphocyte antigen 6E-like [Pelodiscus sinensis]|eukprot:XP_025041847.1 lymphocyte antigen 6E-like [Pelodiscus sinensis]